MTKDFTQRGICQAKKGLLFLRDCGGPAIAACHLCGRPVCSAHQVKEEKGTVCPECASQAETTTTEQQDGTVTTTGQPNVVSRSRYRRRYYSHYGYSPYFYGHSHYYSDHDYRTFDRTGTTAAVAVGAGAAVMAAGEEPGVEASDMDSLDDFMES